MRALSLQSGSNGNCIYVESRGVRLLFDAGISGLQAQIRLATHGVDIRQVDAVIISHDHADHIRCAGVFQRKFGLPVYATGMTYQAAEGKYSLGRMDDVRPFERGQTLDFGAIKVDTLATPHDGADGVAFVVDSAEGRVGVLTDLGHVFDGLTEAVASCDGVFIESNYDEQMLAEGWYPYYLKQRIRGAGGHLSNVQAAELLAEHGGRLQWACLAHLSQENNTPQLALQTSLGIVGGKVPIRVASRSEPTGVFEL